MNSILYPMGIQSVHPPYVPHPAIPSQLILTPKKEFRDRVGFAGNLLL